MPSPRARRSCCSCSSANCCSCSPRASVGSVVPVAASRSAHVKTIPLLLFRLRICHSWPLPSVFILFQYFVFPAANHSAKLIHQEALMTHNAQHSKPLCFALILGCWMAEVALLRSCEQVHAQLFVRNIQIVYVSQLVESLLRLNHVIAQ